MHLCALTSLTSIPLEVVYEHCTLKSAPCEREGHGTFGELQQAGKHSLGLLTIHDGILMWVTKEMNTIVLYKAKVQETLKLCKHLASLQTTVCASLGTLLLSAFMFH